MNFDDFLHPDQVTELAARDRWQAIVELLDWLVAEGKIESKHRPVIENAVRRREMTMSTAIGSGIGLPHTLTEYVKEPVAAFGRSQAGIDFDAPDNKPVYKVCLFLMPKGQFQKHTHVMAKITRLLQRPNF